MFFPHIAERLRDLRVRGHKVVVCVEADSIEVEGNVAVIRKRDIISAKVVVGEDVRPT